MKIIERSVLEALQEQAKELNIEMVRPVEAASFAQDLARLPVADVTVLACFLLAAAKTASDAAGA